jgi:Gluconate 2-dehydrogenase subunit 3
VTDFEHNDESFSRRTMLEAALGVFGAIALSSLPGVRTAAAEAASGTGPRLLSSDETATVDAIVGQIIPTDATPGAREMGVVRFIDRSLVGFLSPLATDFRTGLADFEASCRQSHGGGVFTSLTGDQQIEWLRQVEHTTFFESLQQLTVLGALTMPEYGGNRNGSGWQLIGFEDLHAFQPPFGYYDRDYPGFEVSESAS